MLTARGDAVVLKNPERVAVYDWAALDTLTELGVNGQPPRLLRVDYLQPAFDKAATVGTLGSSLITKPCTATILSLSLPHVGRAQKRMNS